MNVEARATVLLLLVALAATGCRCSGDRIPRGERLTGDPPGENGGVAPLEPSAVSGDDGALVLADVVRVDVGAEGELSWGRAHFVVAEVIRGSGLPVGSSFTQLYQCQESIGRGPPVGWRPCPDSTRRYALWVTKHGNDWTAIAAAAGLDATEIDGLRRAARLRKGSAPPAERAKRLGAALLDKSRTLRDFAINELRYAEDLPRQGAARALLGGAAATADPRARAAILAAGAERLVGLDDDATDVDRDLLQAITRAFMNAPDDNDRVVAFQTLYFAMDSGLANPSLRAKLVAKRLAVARRVDPGPDRVVAALRRFEGRGGLTNGERDLIAIYQSGDAEPRDQ